MHEGVPISGWHFGEPVPDLDRIPQAQWRAVLTPLQHRTRRQALGRTQKDFIAAAQLVGLLWLEGGDAGERSGDTPPPRMPAGAPPARGPGRQVNFRLGADDHEQLLAAARLFAMRPSSLARVLTVRGVNRALYEERRGEGS
ncbi:MAG TPA: hypothetical protein VMY78_02315 [Solirubrobacteraceae bacterium]|nr:hypothetical protein [Solirubrobacteraceae bacterium]